MNYRNLMLAGLTAFAISATASVYAEASKFERPLRVTLGTHYPSDGDLRDLVDDTFYSLGLSYDMWGAQMANGNYYRGGVFGSYTFRDRNGNKLSDFAAGAFGRVYFGEGMALRPYAGGSLGVHWVNYEIGANDDDDLRFGTRLFAGVEHPSGFFGELGYTLAQKRRDVDINGFGVRLGFRF